jgi:hypothetical protein
VHSRRQSTPLKEDVEMRSLTSTQSRYAAIIAAALVASASSFAPRAAVAQTAKPPYQLSVFAKGQDGYSQPDSIVQVGASVVVGYQNGVAKDGTDGKSSTLVQYSLSGRVERTWSVPGHNDGLRVIDGNQLWSVQNEDANPNLVIIDLSTGRQTFYSFPPTPHGGGYDDIVQAKNGDVFMTASNPNLDSAGHNVFPALVRVRVNARRGTLDLTPVMLGNATSIDLSSGNQVTLNLTDPDSMTIDPRGVIAYTSQQDGLLIFVRDPLTPAQQVASLNLTAGGAMTTVDDTQFVPPGAAFMLSADVSADTVYRLDSPLLGFEPGIPYSNSDTAGFIAVLNIDTGVLTTVATGFQSTRGMAFIVPVDSDRD